MNLEEFNLDWNLVQQIVFFIFAAISVSSAFYLLFTKNVLHAIFSLLLTFLGVAGLYVFAGADFIAVTQIMIYVGGILVLLIFGIMLTRKKNEQKDSNQPNLILVGNHHQFWAILLAICIFLGYLKIIFTANFTIIGTKALPETTVKKIGIGLMTDYVFAFEVIGILLLIALIGATYIAKKESK